MISKARDVGVWGEAEGKIKVKVTYVYVVGIDIIGAGICKEGVELDSMTVIYNA